ncbi:hypothetical protein DMH04_13900 [Kibdelosporangium aridum]|uniref:Uncharacterized protein n=1 Tax=Kibdelosporangium aridum TaxID=2030 RepID=A0A428ZDU5_KIBAR|nr:hypothetical protein [Kibdelosporangium aridum]RSM86263.1 hypothetical protein DMH04_13900 [Kibdelosporangium aridum]
MLRAVFARTLKPGVTDEEFIRTWLPPGLTTDSYPSTVSISHNIADQRQIISIFEVDCTPQEFPDVLASLVHPDSAARLAEIVESTQLEAIFEDTATFGTRKPLSPGGR